MRSAHREPMAAHFGLCTTCGFRMCPYVCRETRVLQQRCEMCKAAEPSPTACCSVRVLREQTSEQMVQQLDARALVRDPTLARTFDASCPECTAGEAVFFRSPSTNDNEAMKLAFVCVACNHAWTL